MNRVDVIIVGAGMAGLTAAARLEDRGISTVVLDKGRAPGGRMATRRLGNASFDHGAQHFSARSPEFRNQAREWIDLGLVKKWFESASVTQIGAPVEARHVGTYGMRRIPEHIAAELRVETAVHVERIERTGRGVCATATDGRTWTADGAILTPPAPQTLDLLGRGDIGLSAAGERMLSETQYHPCLAVMVQLDRSSVLPEGHLATRSGPIAWIADNQHKGISTVPAITIHSTPEYARDHLETEPGEWVDRLLEAARPHLAGSSVIAARGHRWRYAQPRHTFDVGAILASAALPLILAGEVFAGARVEGAFLSGMAAADIMEQRL